MLCLLCLLQGVLTTLAIGVHNIPEGLAKATVLVGQGVTPRRALLWSVATCLPQPLVAIPSFIFVEAFKVGGYLWEGVGVRGGETPGIQLCRWCRNVQPRPALRRISALSIKPSLYQG
jgi:hypothetical protein